LDGFNTTGNWTALRHVASPLISCIVVNWNRRELLRACLASLARQEYPNFEVIVVDNGSTDGSEEVVTEVSASFRLIRNTANRGFCAANNQGIAAAHGEFVALLNNDAEAGPQFLSALHRLFEPRPDVGMAAAKIVVWEDPGLIDKAGHLIYPDGQNRGRGTGERDHGQFDRVEEVLWPDGCAAMYRKSMLDQIGGFDEDLFAYGDDAELGLRARLAGWTCLYTPHAVVRHHRGSTLGLQSVTRLKLIERNRLLLAVKLFPWSLLLLNPVYYAGRLIAGAGAAWRGEGETAMFPGVSGKLKLLAGLLWGDLAALAAIPRTLLKRARLRTIRKLSGGQLRALILENRISLRDLTEKAAIR
jgi:GT2 family glycosyltransferase